MPGFIKTKQDEKDWEKAKEIAAESGHKEDWPYITGIYKKMHGGKVAAEGASSERVASRYLTAGRETREIRGYGLTQQEALTSALADDKLEYGYAGGSGALDKMLKAVQIKAPKLAKKVTVEKTTSKVPNKKVYHIATFWPEPQSRIHQDRKFSIAYESATEAANVAKELALLYQIQLKVLLALSGTVMLATITPEKSEQGVWDFTCVFHS